MPISDQMPWAVFLGGQYSDHGTYRVTGTEVRKKLKVSLQMLFGQMADTGGYAAEAVKQL